MYREVVIEGLCKESACAPTVVSSYWVALCSSALEASTRPTLSEGLSELTLQLKGRVKYPCGNELGHLTGSVHVEATL